MRWSKRGPWPHLISFDDGCAGLRHLANYHHASARLMIVRVLVQGFNDLLQPSTNFKLQGLNFKVERSTFELISIKAMICSSHVLIDLTVVQLGQNSSASHLIRAFSPHHIRPPIGGDGSGCLVL